MKRFSGRGAAVALAVALATATTHAIAQTYPSKPVRIIVSFGTGGSVDVLARIVGQKLGESWRQPVLIENRVGAGGNIATEIVAKAGDAHTLLFHTSAIALNASLYPNLPFNTAKDLAPIMKVASTNGVFIVPSSLTAKSLSDVVAMARAQPGKLSFASTGSGSSSHLFMALFMAMAGIEVVHVPYKNISQMYTDFIPGRTQMSISTLPSATPYLQAGSVRALAVTSSQRSDSLRDVPTMQEAGFPTYEATTWYGAFAPAGTAPAIVRRINGEIQRILALEDVRQRFTAVGLDPAGGTPQQFEKYFLEEIVKWGQVVKTNGLRAE